MSLKNSIQPLLAQDFDTSTLILGTYQPVSGNGFEFAIVYLRIINNSQADIFISYDGISDHDFVPGESTINLPFQAQSAPNNNVAMMRKGTRIYVRGVASNGTLYVAGYYIHPGN